MVLRRQRVHSEAATHKAALHKVTSAHVLEGYTKEENEQNCLKMVSMSRHQYLFTAEILPAPALASPPARTKEDSVAFMDVDAAAVLLVADEVVFVVRFIMLLLSSPITMVEPVLLLALDDELPFCC